MTNFSFFKDPVFWSNTITIFVLFFTAVLQVFPGAVYISTIIVVLNYILVNYLHKQAVGAAAKSSVALGRAVSGQ